MYCISIFLRVLWLISFRCIESCLRNQLLVIVVKEWIIEIILKISFSFESFSYCQQIRVLLYWLIVTYLVWRIPWCYVIEIAISISVNMLFGHVDQRVDLLINRYISCRKSTKFIINLAWNCFFKMYFFRLNYSLLSIKELFVWAKICIIVFSFVPILNVCITVISWYELFLSLPSTLILKFSEGEHICFNLKLVSFT